MPQPMSNDMDIVTIHHLIERGARNALDLQQEDGSFPPGQNYTYDETETPVRTTSHWLRTLTKAYEITNEEIFANAANSAVDYLLGDEIRPNGFSYRCRIVDSKDECNGLVGQASPIRALAEASTVIDRKDARETAEELFLLHPFSTDLGLWERVEVDGQNLSFDRTLNHQIIFAAASALLAPELKQAATRVTQFLDKLEQNMHLHSNGLIKHYVRPPLPAVLKSVFRFPRQYNMLINEVASRYYSYSTEYRKKERGYQTVNVTVLSRLKYEFPDHDFWDSSTVSRCLEFIRSNEQDLIDGVGTKHGTPLQALAIAKIRHRFEEIPIKKLKYLIISDLSLNSGGEMNIFDLGSIDSSSQIALISTLTDIPNLQIG